MSQFARRTQFAVGIVNGTPPASIAFRAATSSAPANSTSITVTIPASVQVGDGLILCVSTSSTTLSGDPSGWTATSAGTITQGSLYSRILTRVAQSGDAGSTVTLSFAAQNKAGAVIVAYNGINGAAANDIFIDVQASATDSSTASHTAPAVTTTKNNDMIVSVVTDKSSGTTPTTVWTPPSGTTLRASVYNTGAGATSIGVADPGSGVPAEVVPAQIFTSDQAQTNGITWTFALTTGSGSSPGDTQAPSAPTSLVATGQSATSVQLSWVASTDNIGVNHYNIYQNSTKIATSTGTSYTNSGLTASTTYNYFVTAVDAAGNESAHSNTASATTSSGGGTSGALPAFGLCPDTSGIGTYSSVKSYVPYLTGHRLYVQGTSQPATYAQSIASGDPALGATTCISFKLDYAQAAAGAYNSWARSFALSCPPGTIFIWRHEPEDDYKSDASATWQNYTAGINQMYGAIGNDTPVKRATCFMEWAWSLGGGNYGANYHWLDGVNPDNIDYMGVDIYSQAYRNWGPASQYAQPFMDWCNTKLGVTKPWIIAELGLEDGWDTAGLDYVSWFEDAMTWGKNNNVVGIYLFDLLASGVPTHPWTSTMLTNYNTWLTAQGVYN